MVKRKNDEPEIPPSINAIDGVELLRKQKDKLQQILEKSPIDRAQHNAWMNTTQDYLMKIFGSKSENVFAVIHASGNGPLIMGMGDGERERYRESQIENQIQMIDSCIEQLETQIELSGKIVDKNGIKQEIGNKVFIVHGHNNEIKESVARLISDLGLHPIILHEQPNKGRTLIEKFTDYADVGFAIILLTSDDVGAAKAEKDNLMPRARQNVVIELGYFLGKLGRDKVCPIYEEGVELPSDYEGVVYTPLDPSGKWKYDLIKELKAIGFNVDTNKLF